MSDLAEIFDALGTTEHEDGSRSAPMRLLPELITQYETRRKVQLLSELEKEQMVTPTSALQPSPRADSQIP